jgi:hypothetical protein
VSLQEMVGEDRGSSFYCSSISTIEVGSTMDESSATTEDSTNNLEGLNGWLGDEAI